MTAYWQTNVLSDTFPVEDAYKDKAKKWLLDNLEKQPEQLKTIAKSIGKFPDATKGVDTITEYDKNNQKISIKVLSLDSIKKLLK